MAVDEGIAERIRLEIGPLPGLSEKKMFGGLAFLLNGNMACGVHGSEIILRIDPETTDAVLKKPHTRVFDLTGRPMTGWILVHPDGVKTRAALAKWLRLGVEYAGSLPKK